MSDLEQNPVKHAERWGAYLDRDSDVTLHDSRSDAEGAILDFIDSDTEPGEEVEYFVAPFTSAKEYLQRKSPDAVGEAVMDQINCMLSDDTYADGPSVALSELDTVELGRVVLKFLIQRAESRWWTADTQREERHTYIAGSDDEESGNG